MLGVGATPPFLGASTGPIVPIAAFARSWRISEMLWRSSGVADSSLCQAILAVTAQTPKASTRMGTWARRKCKLIHHCATPRRIARSCFSRWESWSTTTGSATLGSEGKGNAGACACRPNMEELAETTGSEAATGWICDSGHAPARGDE